jgi:hypothetical protein
LLFEPRGEGQRDPVFRPRETARLRRSPRTSREGSLLASIIIIVVVVVAVRILIVRIPAVRVSVTDEGRCGVN